MNILVDTNVVLRWVDKKSPQHPVARDSVKNLVDRRNAIYVTPQVLIEFWNVATRPAEHNGFGMTRERAREELGKVEFLFALAPDTALVFERWKDLVFTHKISGVQVHDARLAAVMAVHGITHILTFNGDDFRRYPDVTIVDPREAAAQP